MKINVNNKSSKCYLPKVLCDTCGYFHIEQPGLYNFAQNVGDCCREFGCFGKMIVYNLDNVLKVESAKFNLKSSLHN